MKSAEWLKGIIGFWSVCLILIILTNVNALDFDTSEDTYTSNFVENNEIIKLRDGIFERDLNFLRITNENILLKEDDGNVLLIEINKNKQIDINDDGFNDVELSYNSFDNGRAEIGLKKLENINKIKEPIKENNKIKKITYWILGFILFLIAIYIIKKIKNRKYY
ncbi:hypothetical protein J4442_05580 [Candidatus Woesearchaeota archaeon]|nr:hypothetical protein [Candidatus Woesearchaeota archaeon]